MFKKIFIFVLVFVSFFSVGFTDECPLGDEVSASMTTCLSSTQLVEPPSDVQVESDSFKELVNGWITNIAIYLGLAAIGAIAYGGFMMTISTGEEEKIKKGKDIVKWGILGFLGVVGASSLIAITVNVMYSLGG